MNLRWRRLLVAGAATGLLAGGAVAVGPAGAHGSGAQVAAAEIAGGGQAVQGGHRLAATPAPSDLVGSAGVRTDGAWRLHGIQLDWTVGQNSGQDNPPGDWNDGNANYPKAYQVWINGGAIKQTVYLDWCRWWGCWRDARQHWVNLGESPAASNTVKIRARLDDGTWSDFTNEVTVASAP